MKSSLVSVSPSSLGGGSRGAPHTLSHAHQLASGLPSPNVLRAAPPRSSMRDRTPPHKNCRAQSRNMDKSEYINADIIYAYTKVTKCHLRDSLGASRALRSAAAIVRGVRPKRRPCPSELAQCSVILQDARRKELFAGIRNFFGTPAAPPQLPIPPGAPLGGTAGGRVLIERGRTVLLPRFRGQLRLFKHELRRILG
jgi:hypothetical protein